jgi:hypothetical protein
VSIETYCGGRGPSWLRRSSSQLAQSCFYSIRRPRFNFCRTTLVGNHSRFLKVAGSYRNACPARVQHVGKEFLCQRHNITAQAVLRHQKPPRELFLNVMRTIAGRQMGCLQCHFLCERFVRFRKELPKGGGQRNASKTQALYSVYFSGCDLISLAMIHEAVRTLAYTYATVKK